MQRNSIGRLRTNKLRKALEAKHIGLLILEDREDITWLCGCGDAEIVLVPADNREQLAVFTRNKEKFLERTWGEFETKDLSQVKNVAKKIRTSKIASDCPYKPFSSHLIESLKIKILNGFTVFWKVASVKDQVELERFKIGAMVAGKLMKSALDNLEIGIMEIDLNDKVIMEGRTLVHEENEKLDRLYPSYVPMIRGIIEDNPAVKITFGSSTAEPHAMPRCSKLRKNDTVSICIVPNIDGYWVELELTTLVGKPSAKPFEYNCIKRKVLKDTLDLCLEGIKPCEIDEYVREKLKAKNLENKILHASGHGIGLKLHEPPILKASGDELTEEPLQSGQTLAIEPGFYIKGRYGFRDSVTIVIRRTKPMVLTNFPTPYELSDN